MGVAVQAPAAPATPRSRAATRGTVLFVVLSQSANVLNYASTLVFSRVLEPSGFGELTSLLALALVLAVPLGAAQVVVAERVARAHAVGDEARVRALARHALGHVTTIATLAGLLYLALSPLTIAVLDVRQPGPVVALAPFIVLAFVSTVANGVLQGTERFAALGAVVFAGSAARLLVGIPWAAAGGGAGGAIGGQALGLLLVLVVVGVVYRELWTPGGTGAAARGLRRRPDVHMLSASGAFIGFALLANLDLVLARLVLAHEEAGLYAALSTFSKIIVFLPAAVSQLMVPRAARATGAGAGEAARVLRRASAVAVGGAFVVAVPGVVAPGALIDVMFGSDYAAARDGVLPTVLAGLGLSVLFVVCHYSVAIRDRTWVRLLAGGVVLQAAAVLTLASTPVGLAWIQAGVVAVVLAVNELRFHSLRPARVRPGSAGA